MATRFYSSVEYGSARDSTDPDVLYFNATINNNNTEDPEAGEVDPQVTASYQRQYPLLQDANDYMVSAVRLSTNGATRNLPILIPQIQPSTAGVTWTGAINGAIMTVTSSPPPSIALGSQISGSGTALIVNSSGQTVAQIPYTITVGQNSLPITVLSTPPPGQTQWILSSPPAQAFWAGDGGVNPPGLYTVGSLVNANLFVGAAQSDINLTVYSFTVTNDASGGMSQVFVEWQTQEPTAQVPPSPVITQKLGSEYYFCYSYEWWINLCNTALTQAWTAAGSPGSGPPVLWAYTSPNNAIQFLIAYQDDIPSTTFTIYMNSNMANLFPNFPGQWTNGPNGQTYQVHQGSYFAPPVNVDFGGISYQSLSLQEFPGTTGWTPVDALVITTSQLPVVAEQTTPPSLIGQSDYGFSRAVSEAAFQPILLDVTRHELTGTEDWRSNFVYEATGEYRMISLTAQSQPISSVDLQAWWRCRLDDSLYPLRLTNGSSLSIKLMFRRKQMGV